MNGDGPKDQHPRIDLLALLHDGLMDEDAAYDAFDEAVRRVHARETPDDWSTQLGLSSEEARGSMHAASLRQLMRVRYEGWPSASCRCGLSLDGRQDPWWFVHRVDGRPALRHIERPIDVPDPDPCQSAISH
jgi:hypothetical protein